MRHFAILLLACLPIFPQTNTGAITGTVFDQSQAVIGGVKITAMNRATNVTRTAVTNSNGVYSIPALEPGSYRLSLEKSGFKKTDRGPVTIGSSSTVELDFNLEVGNTATEVTVNTDAPLVQQASSTVQYRTDLKRSTSSLSPTRARSRSRRFCRACKATELRQ